MPVLSRPLGQTAQILEGTNKPLAISRFLLASLKRGSRFSEPEGSAQTGDATFSWGCPTQPNTLLWDTTWVPCHANLGGWGVVAKRGRDREYFEASSAFAVVVLSLRKMLSLHLKNNRLSPCCEKMPTLIHLGPLKH